MTHSKKHILVVDPGQNTPELDAFNRLQMRYPQYNFTYHLPAMFGMASIFDANEPIDAIVIFGSGASAQDKLAWQIPMNEWLQTQLHEGIPCLGICYGHQLLAYLFGASLGFVHASQAKECGLRTIKALPALTNERLREGPLIVSHRECVTQLPVSCELLAVSDLVMCEAFRHRDLPAWGIQAHPEAGPGFLRNQSIPIEEPQSAYEHGGLWIDEFFHTCLK